VRIHVVDQVYRVQPTTPPQHHDRRFPPQAQITKQASTQPNPKHQSRRIYIPSPPLISLLLQPPPLPARAPLLAAAAAAAAKRFRTLPSTWGISLSFPRSFDFFLSSYFSCVSDYDPVWFDVSASRSVLCVSAVVCSLLHDSCFLADYISVSLFFRELLDIESVSQAY
jgi:hypothetical protein